MGKKQNMPITFLGGGTNVLISDKGIEGLVIGLQKLKTFREWEEEDRLCINALAGVSKSQIMQIFFKAQTSSSFIFVWLARRCRWWCSDERRSGTGYFS